MRSLEAVTSAAELIGAREAAVRLRGAEDLPRLGVQLTALYREVSKPAFARIQLIVAVEENYGLSFSRAEIRSLRIIGDLRRSLATKGIVP